MKPAPSKSKVLAAGFAMFSMFFGAGNVVFPLAVGQAAKDHNLFAILGLLITAVGVPFLGLISMTLYNGNYTRFFERIGKIPGFLVALVIMGMIGPLGATPRLLTVSYSTVTMYFPGMGLAAFSLLSCILIFFLTFKKSSILDILGYFLTPLLLASLVIVIIVGIFSAGQIPPSSDSAWSTFFMGLNEGYQTMDLPGALFFSSIVLECLEGSDTAHHAVKGKNFRNMIMMTLKAGALGMTLLALTYTGFSYVASAYSLELDGIAKDRILGAIALKTLGPYGALIAIVSVALACLTTAIALIVVFSEFLHYEIFKEKFSYVPSLLISLGVTYFVSTWGFDGIAKVLTPILQITYPSLIVLSIVNLMHKLWHFRPVKTPVYITFGISLLLHLLPEGTSIF